MLLIEYKWLFRAINFILCSWRLPRYVKYANMKEFATSLELRIVTTKISVDDRQLIMLAVTLAYWCKAKCFWSWSPLCICYLMAQLSPFVLSPTHVVPLLPFGLLPPFRITHGSKKRSNIWKCIVEVQNLRVRLYNMIS